MDEDVEKGVEVPYSQLPADTLERVIREFVLREGTDYGTRLYSLEEKIAAVRGQIKAGKVKIVFDFETNSCNVVPAIG